MTGRKLARERRREAARLARDPATPADTLAAIAHEFADLRSDVAENPNAYPALRSWIAQHPPPTPEPRNRAIIWAAAAAVVALVTAGVTGVTALSTAAQTPQQSTAESSPTSDGEPAGDNEERGGEGGSGADGATTASDASDLPPVIFILDASGSMVRETAPGRTRMDEARDALDSTIANLAASTEAGVLVFGTGTGNSEAEREAGCSDILTLAELGAVDHSIVSEAIRGVEESGFTPIGPALRKASEMIAPGEALNIVLISDGVDTCSPPPACETASQLTSENPNLAIHVVGFAVDDDEAAQQQLRCIAGVGRGSFTWAGSADQLAARLDVAADPVRAATSLTSRGTRGVVLGMSLDDVLRSVPGSEIGSRVEEGDVEVVWVECPWGSVELHDDVVVGIRTSDDGMTAEGLTVGDDIDAAVVLYGTPVETSSDDDGEYAVFRTGSGGTSAYRFYVDASGSRIEQIVLCRCLPHSDSIAAFADWEVSFDGVGPVRLGASLDEVMAAVPDFRSPDAYGYWQPLGPTVAFTIALTDDQRVRAITVGETWYSGSPPNGAVMPQAHGIRIGDTGRTAIWGFPGGTGFHFSAAASTSYTVSDRRGRTLAFNVNGGIDDLDNAIVYGFTVADRTVGSGWW